METRGEKGRQGKRLLKRNWQGREKEDGVGEKGRVGWTRGTELSRTNLKDRDIVGVCSDGGLQTRTAPHSNDLNEDNVPDRQHPIYVYSLKQCVSYPSA